MKYILALLLIVLVPVVSAQTVLDEWVYPGEQFSFDGTSGSIAIASNNNVMVTTVDGQHVILSPGASRYMGEYLVTYEDIHWQVCTASDCDPKQYGKLDPSNPFNVIPGVLLTIDKRVPEIKITRNVEKTSVLLNTPVEITVTVENTGDEAATNIVYKDAFPEGIQLLSTSHGVLQANTLTVNLGTMQADASFDLTYKVQLTERIEATLSAHADYKFDGKSLTATSGFITLKPRDVFEIKSEVVPSSLEVGEEAEMVFSVTNTNEVGVEDAKLTELVIRMPQNVTVLHYPTAFTKWGDTYTLTNQDFMSEQKKTYNFTVTSTQSTQQVADVTLDGFFRGSLPTQNLQQSISWGTPSDPTHTYVLTLSPSSRTYLAETTGSLWAIIQNSGDYAMSDVIINITAFDTQQTITVPHIAAGQSYVTSTVSVPLPNSTQTQKAVANITFTSGLDNTVRSYERTADVGVRTIFDALEISTVPSKSATLLQNETQTITIRVKNTLSNNPVTNVDVQTYVPAQFGTSPQPKTISLSPEQDLGVFAFTINTPMFVDVNDTDIITTLSFANTSMNGSYTQNVDIETPNINIERELPSSATQGSIIEDRYVVTNQGDRTVTNIRFSQSGAPGFDLHSGQRHMVISELAPGESVTRTSLARLTAPGSIELPSVNARFFDRWGNEHDITSSKKSISVSPLTINEPALTITTNVVFIENRQVTLESIVENKASRAASASFSHESTTTTLSVDGYGTASTQYVVAVPLVENITFSVPSVRYTAHDQQWVAVGIPLQLSRELLPENVTQNATVNGEPVTQSPNQTQPVTHRASSASGTLPSWFAVENAFAIIVVLGFTLVSSVVAFTFVRKRLLANKNKVRGEFDDYFK